VRLSGSEVAQHKFLIVPDVILNEARDMYSLLAATSCIDPSLCSG
jgi:hypothetical protein